MHRLIRHIEIVRRQMAHEECDGAVIDDMLTLLARIRCLIRQNPAQIELRYAQTSEHQTVALGQPPQKRIAEWSEEPQTPTEAEMQKRKRRRRSYERAAEERKGKEGGEKKRTG